MTNKVKQCDKPIINVVAAYITNEDGEFLIAQRRAGDSHGLLWEFPGGKIEKGESPQKALARELKEELGVTARVGRLQNMFTDETVRMKISLFLYSARIIKGVPHAYECRQWKYCPIEKISRFSWAPVDKKIIYFLKRKEPITAILRKIEAVYNGQRATHNPSVTHFAEATKRSPFHVLMSCLISLRTKDEVTYAAASRLFERAQTPKAVAALSIKELETIVYPAGFYRKKARLLKEISRILIRQYDGIVPESLETLLSIKGIGRKTAQLVRSLAFGRTAICVDTHVHRLSNRLGLVRTHTVYDTERALQNRVPVEWWIRLNTLLVFWGRSICTPVSPRCDHCMLGDLCEKVSVISHR